MIPASFFRDAPTAERRAPILASNVVATSQPLAAQAGLRMLYQGGNAVDAALAAAIALTVVEPTSNGIGSDAFAIVSDKGGQLHGLNASGKSPQAWSPARFAGRTEMPTLGWESVTTPGAVSAWVALSQKFGQLPFETLFEPAIAYARLGFLLSPITAQAWAAQVATRGIRPDWIATFLFQGRVPQAGDLVQLPDHARTLRLIAQTGGEAFYRGELAQRMVTHSESEGGALTLHDLASHQPTWVQPLSREFEGVTLHELPPNGQGLAALLMLGILEHTPWRDFAPESAQSLHFQIEAMKLSFADIHEHLSDLDAMHLTTQEMLDNAYLKSRAQTIDPHRAQAPTCGIPRRSGTVYLTAADADGCMVSFIQSNYMGFGSGVVVPGTGISMQNRGAGFSLEPGHPNEVGGGKRPFHTIIPGFVTRQGQPLMSFGVMGGAMQAQGHAQMMARIFGHGQNPQFAADAPRWQVFPTGEVGLEAGFAPAVSTELEAMGHRCHPMASGEAGGAQLIYCVAGGYIAASDWRKDGQAVGF